MLNSSHVFCMQIKFVFYSCYHQKTKVSVLSAETDIFIHIQCSSKLLDLLRRILLCASRETGGSDSLSSSVGRANRPGSSMEVVRQLLSVEERWKTWNISRQMITGSFPFQGTSLILFCNVSCHSTSPTPCSEHYLDGPAVSAHTYPTHIQAFLPHSLVSPTQFIAGSSDLLSFKTLFISGMKKESSTQDEEMGRAVLLFLCVCLFYFYL